MNTDPSIKPKRPVLNVAVRIVICALVLLAGVMGMKILAAMKKPPTEIPSEERPLEVEVVKVSPENVPVVITGYGEVAVLNTVVIAPEVSGRIVHVHPRLEAGETIGKGEVLFRIDDTDYRAALLEAEAAAAQLKNTISRLNKQYNLDRQRLKTIERNRDLARAEFERIRKLHQTGKVVAQSSVDAAEQQYNIRADQADQLAEAVALYPLRIKEAESGLAAARARLTMAETRLRRCEVRAPFDGRVKSVSLETGQYVNPGLPVVTLADDSVLELRVPLDSRDARQWLRFTGENPTHNATWFSGLEPVTCRIRWTEDQDGHTWRGRLHRVVAFNPQNRTLTVAIRVEAKTARPEVARSDTGRCLPLVEGMFCAVEIPGKILQNVFRLPRWAVSFENTVYLAQNNRLKTIPVQIARIQGEETIVADGIQAGDLVITTRLIDPLENSLLKIMN